MNKGQRNKLILTAFCCLFALLMALPSAYSYGSSFNDASMITNGTHSNITFASGDLDVYYKIYCSLNDSLLVTLSNFGHPTFDLDLHIYDPFEVRVDYSLNIAASESCSETTDMNGYFYIRVEKEVCCGGSIGTTTFTLTVSGATESLGIPIPGFEVILVIFSLISATGLIMLLFKQKKIVIQ